MTIKICINLIHHYNSVRNMGALGAVDLLKARTEFFKKSALVYTGWQPDIHPLSYKFLFYKRVITFIHEIKWAFHSWPAKDLLTRLPYTAALALLKIFGSISITNRKSNKASIELELSIKHVRAWTTFLDSDYSWLLVIEDDVKFCLNSVESLGVTEAFIKSVGQQPAFLSLTAPYSITEMHVGRLVNSNRNQLLEFKSGCSNTTAAYMINREAAELLVSSFRLAEYLKFLNADLLLNSLFMRIHKSGIRVVSAHLENELLSNSSVSGTLGSSIR